METLSAFACDWTFACKIYVPLRSCTGGRCRSVVTLVPYAYMAGVYDTALNSTAVLTQYSALMRYFSTRVDEARLKMHQGCTSPVRFRHVAVNYDDQDSVHSSRFWTDMDNDAYDFLILPPLQIACISSGYGIMPLLSRIRSKKAILTGELPVGGLIFTRAGNPNVNSFADLKDKVLRTAG